MQGFQLKPCGVRELCEANSIGNGGCPRATKQFRTDGEVKFIHQPGFEQSRVEFAAAFAEQSLDVPFLSEIAKGASKVDFGFAANHGFRNQVKEAPKFGLGRARGGQKDRW